MKKTIYLFITVFAFLGFALNTFVVRAENISKLSSKLEGTNIGEITPTEILYLNGKTGNDDFDGVSPEKAVKSFERAKELAIVNQNIKQIMIIGTTELFDKVTLAETNAKIIRGESFNDYLFSVPEGNRVSLSDIIIDGNSENNPNITKSLIKINRNATLNIEQGANLKNNKIKKIENEATLGGAIEALDAIINMNDGTIENNQATYGGGVYLQNSTMNFFGGIIQNNVSNTVIDTHVTPTQYYSAGGGILANYGSIINMAGDAKVLNNYAQEIGGGISLGSNQWGPTNILNMTGGTVDGNIAGASGGGIFVQAKYFSGGASKAYIEAGKITNNYMNASGYTGKMFGGGGIYVNGANNKYNVNGENGELHIKNVVITGNESKNDGAGFASCPISKTKIYATNGAAIYGNKATKGVNEIYVLSSRALGLHSGNPEYDISTRMLGGTPYNWKKKDGTPLELSKHKGILTKHNEKIELYTDEVGNKLTSELARVIISGNKSETRGGGIGSNGTVIMGTEETTSVSVEKKWSDDDNADQKRPELVEVKLIASVADKKYDIEVKQISKEEDWKIVFADLPSKVGNEDIKYFIQETDVAGYTCEISGTAENGYVITNSKMPEVPEIPITIPTDHLVVSAPRPDVPKTGYSSDMPLFIILVGAAGALFTIGMGFFRQCHDNL